MCLCRSKCGIVDPPIFRAAHLYPLPEARYCQEALSQMLLQPVQLHWAFHDQNAGNDHWIRWPVHPEPSWCLLAI